MPQPMGPHIGRDLDDRALTQAASIRSGSESFRREGSEVCTKAAVEMSATDETLPRSGLDRSMSPPEVNGGEGCGGSLSAGLGTSDQQNRRSPRVEGSSGP